MGFATSLVVLLFVAAAEAKEYLVGGSSGWTTGVDYGNWASANTFNVGDVLVFQYGTLHSVNEVSEEDYSACSASNAIQSYGNQNTQITLTAPGTRYFICGTTVHCSEGMKLAVTVASATSASTTPGSSFTPTTGGSFTPTTGGSFTPTTGGSFTPGSTATPYQPYNPYNRPYYYNSCVRIRSGFYGLLFTVIVVTTLLTR